MSRELVELAALFIATGVADLFVSTLAHNRVGPVVLFALGRAPDRHRRVAPVVDAPPATRTRRAAPRANTRRGPGWRGGCAPRCATCREAWRG